MKTSVPLILFLEYLWQLAFARIISSAISGALKAHTSFLETVKLLKKKALLYKKKTNYSSCTGFPKICLKKTPLCSENPMSEGAPTVRQWIGGIVVNMEGLHKDPGVRVICWPLWTLPWIIGFFQSPWWIPKHFHPSDKLFTWGLRQFWQSKPCYCKVHLICVICLSQNMILMINEP